MATISGIKFYRSQNEGLGGSINLSDPVLSNDPNNVFPLLTRAQQDSGTTHYLCIYVRNENADILKHFKWFQKSGTVSGETSINWAVGPAGKNGTETTIGAITTAPSGVTDWKDPDDAPIEIMTDANPNDYRGIWLRYVTDAGCPARKNDQSTFSFTCDVVAGTTGEVPDTSGGGTGSSGGNDVPTVTDWKIAVLGDTSPNSTTSSVLNLANKYDRVIHVGDQAYGDEGDWFSMVNGKSGLKAKMITAYGNHEYDDGLSNFKSYWGHSKTYYMKTFKNVAIIVIDDNQDEDSDAPDIDDGQEDAVDSMLSSAANNTAIDWIFVVMHHPWFGSSSNHEYNDCGMVQVYHSKFTSKKVAFVFTGHNHNWQMSKKVSYNSGNPTSPNIVDSSSPFTNDTAGLIHIVSGTGGHDSGDGLYDLDSSPGFNLYQNRSHNGVFEIVATNNGKTLTCQFVDKDGSKEGTQIVYTTT